jgi:hypothetical protein
VVGIERVGVHRLEAARALIVPPRAQVVQPQVAAEARSARP